MSQSDLENEINKAVSKEIQRNVSVEIKPEIIPFHALPIYKESTSFVLNEEEKEVIVDGYGWKYIPEKVGISEIWAIINKKGTFNQSHNHPGSYLSAAYYVKAPENCGNIHFYEPNEVKKFHTPPIEKMTELSSSGFSVKPEEGNLLIFPSYLYHDVGKSLSDEDRIVISFNVSILPIKK